MSSKSTTHYDVVVIGAGLAGLCLVRQLSLTTDKKVLLLERWTEQPNNPKVGESLVQVGGYYFSRVLDLEEYLMRRHFMKYNLRFYWKGAERENDCFEDYDQAYIRRFSNIATYQLDRPAVEAELFRLAQEDRNLDLRTSVSGLDIDISEVGPHQVGFKEKNRTNSVSADWVVDTTGRSRLLSRQMEMAKQGEIRHGSVFLWVEGLVDIEKLTERSSTQRRLNRTRAEVGHSPIWLATNHFMGEGFWFWVIPLHGHTSLGLVYDKELFPHEQVSKPEKLIDWVCQEFPLFARDLPRRKVLHQGILRDYAHDCEQTIHPTRWAMSGVSGRFTDPLYSPGSDFIGIHNTLICDAIMTEDSQELADRCRVYDILMRAYYSSLIPTFATSYNALGNQESFVLKYTWELSVYFTHFVFPFINDLITDRWFVVSFLNKFSRLGKINHNVQSYISAYYRWKKTQPGRAGGPRFHDFTSLEPLRRAESTFYKVGMEIDEARKVLDDQLINLTELARFIVCYIDADVAGDLEMLHNRSFVEAIDLEDCPFDVGQIQKRHALCVRKQGRYEWSFSVCTMDKFWDDDLQTPETAAINDW